jgi:hypothetical protein
VNLALPRTFLDLPKSLTVIRIGRPLSGMVSLVVVMRDGKAIETATFGCEGVVGAMAGLGLHVSQVRAIAQIPMFASKMNSTALRKAASNSKPIANLCIRSNEMLLAQARITAACNALHHVEARFCRWLLQTRDRAESDTERGRSHIATGAGTGVDALGDDRLIWRDVVGGDVLDGDLLLAPAPVVVAPFGQQHHRARHLVGKLEKFRSRLEILCAMGRPVGRPNIGT